MEKIKVIHLVFRTKHTWRRSFVLVDWKMYKIDLHCRVAFFIDLEKFQEIF